MKGKILVLAEHKDNIIDNITWELIGKGRVLADQWKTELSVLILGAQLESLVAELKLSGIDVILQAENPELEQYNAEFYTSVITTAIRDYQPALVLNGYTYLGMEAVPAAAVRLGGTMVTNCSKLEIDGETISVLRPMFGGALQSKIVIEGPTPHFISIEKGVLPREDLTGRNVTVQTINVTNEASQLRTKIIETLLPEKGDIDITKARILISVGRGIGGPDKLPLIEKLAEALDADISCSRPVADMGWLPFARQVGISANTVSPDIYVACGISGASQHVTSMRDSNKIIAINKDPNAAIFRVADFGVIGDLFDVVPALIKEAKAS